MASSFPRAVEDKDLYEGPQPTFPAGPDPLAPKFQFADTEKPDRRSRPDYVATITAALDMLGARLLALIAVIAACLMWSWSVYEPEPQRLYAAIGFSVTVLLPIVILYFRKG